MADSSFVAVVAAIFGGAGLKVIERMFARSEQQSDEATIIRKELRDEKTHLDIRNDKLQAENDELRLKYFVLLAENAELKLKLLEARTRLGPDSPLATVAPPP